MILGSACTPLEAPFGVQVNGRGGASVVVPSCEVPTGSTVTVRVLTSDGDPDALLGDEVWAAEVDGSTGVLPLDFEPEPDQAYAVLFDGGLFTFDEAALAELGPDEVLTKVGRASRIGDEGRTVVAASAFRDDAEQYCDDLGWGDRLIGVLLGAVLVSVLANLVAAMLVVRAWRRGGQAGAGLVLLLVLVGPLGWLALIVLGARRRRS